MPDERKFVVFIDSLGPDDVENYTNFIKSSAYDGKMEAGSPYVTPKVMGEIYTGKNPGEHGLPSVSRYDTEPRTRPAAPTLPEIVAEDDTHDDVLNLGLPFIAPPQAQTEDKYWHISSALNDTSIAPRDAQNHLMMPGPAGDLSDLDEDGNLLWNHRRDKARTTFQTARSLAGVQDFDVVFISCRLLDSYCHYRFNEPEDEVLTDRQMLLQSVIDKQVEYLTTQGEVFVFGDHGATEMDDVFKINRWLADNGHLDVEIHEDKIGWAVEEGLMEDPDEDTEGTVRTIGMPGVTINETESVAVSDDPFSGGITLLDGATESEVKELIADLESTPYVEGVEWSREKWDGDLIDEAPDLYPIRSVGTFISGNLAEEMGGVEITRSGVHHPTGAWGSTADIDAPDTVTPTELHHIILEDFLGIEDPGVGQGRDYGKQRTGDEDGDITDDQRQHLRKLGYL